MNILRGIYTAASGMLVETMRMDVASNNLANVDTAGFQRQTAHVYAFPQAPIARDYHNQRRVLGTLGTGAFAEGSSTSFAPGTLKTTENPLDAALIGPGFLQLKRRKALGIPETAVLRLTPAGCWPHWMTIWSAASKA